MMRQLLLLVWLPFFVFLFPLPPQAGKQLIHEVRQTAGFGVDAPTETKTQGTSSESELDTIVAALWVRWFQNVALLVLGLFVGVFAWRGYRHWQLIAFGMSLVYLMLVVLRYLHLTRAVPDAILFFGTESEFIKILQLNVRLVGEGISNGSFIRPAWIVYNEFLMPVFQIAVLAWVLRLYSRKTVSAQ